MEIKKVKELMLKAFKMGQEKYDAEEYPAKLWIASEVENAN